MPDDNTTAQATGDSVETPETTQDSNEHQEEVEETAEETAENNEADPEDSAGAPEEEDEEMDPLLKAKKHADRKITELGHAVSAKDQALESREQVLIAAVTRNPDLLIEMYDDKSELYDLDLANKIRDKAPEVYQKADAIFRQRQSQAPVYQAPVYQAPAPQDIESIVDAKVREREHLNEFRKTLGYNEADFSVIIPGVKKIADAIRSENPEVTMDTALRSAFISLYPGNYEKSIVKSAAIKASTKAAMEGTAGGGSASQEGPGSKFKWTPEEQKALEVSGLTKERYLKVVHNIT